MPTSAEGDTCRLLCLDLPKAEAARQALPAPGDLDALAAAAKGLADSTRLAVVLALGHAGRACVCDLAWVTAKPEKLVSHHVRLLKATGLARSERDGRMVMYELTERGRTLAGAVATLGVEARG